MSSVGLEFTKSIVEEFNLLNYVWGICLWRLDGGLTTWLVAEINQRIFTCLWVDIGYWVGTQWGFTGALTCSFSMWCELLQWMEVPSIQKKISQLTSKNQPWLSWDSFMTCFYYVLLVKYELFISAEIQKKKTKWVSSRRWVLKDF